MTYSDLLDDEVEEGVLGVNLDRRLGTHAAHGRTQTAVELEHPLAASSTADSSA
jgi:hypothetical protein